MGVFKRALADLDLPELKSLGPSTSAKQALEYFHSNKIGAVGITNENGKVAGILSERDLVLRLDPEEFGDWDKIELSRIMTKKVFSIGIDKHVVDALDLMAKMEFRHLPVMKEDGSFLMMSARDILNLLIERYRPLCEKFGTLTTWETQVGHIHDESHVFHGQKDTLETGSFLFASMKEIGGSDMLKVDSALPIRELWGAMKAAHLPVSAVVSYSTLLCGIITERDLLYKAFIYGEEALDWPASKIMTTGPHSMLLKHHLVYALNNMAVFKYRNILVVDEDRFPIRIAELIDFLKFFRHVLQDINFAVE